MQLPLTSFTHAEITVTEDAKPYKAAELAECALPEGVNGLVQLVDCAELASPMLVSPEGHWAVINVAALAKDLATLDAIPCEQLSPETFAKINYHLSLIGVTPCRVATYEEACKEGWAAAPPQRHPEGRLGPRPRHSADAHEDRVRSEKGR